MEILLWILPGLLIGNFSASYTSNASKLFKFNLIGILLYIVIYFLFRIFSDKLTDAPFLKSFLLVVLFNTIICAVTTVNRRTRKFQERNGRNWDNW